MLDEKTHNRFARAFLLAVVFATFAASANGRAKTDVIVLENGDHVTGEIKELYHGRLRLSTSSMSTVYIEWQDVIELESQYYFEIEDRQGYKFYGIPVLTEEGEFRVTRADAVATLEKLQVIRITPIEKSFLSRLNGSVSFGYSYTKGSRVGRTDIAFDVRYRVEKNWLQLQGASSVTTEQDKAPITRADASLSYQHLFARRLFSDLTGASYRNDEQGFALRLILAAGVGAHIVQTNTHVLGSQLGVSVNREWPSDPGTVPTDNLEGVISAGYSAYVYNTPKTDLTSEITFYPRILPNFDRYRIDADVSWSQEIISDFFVVLTFWDNYNSKPPAEGNEKNDWGIATSIGYKF